MKTFYIAATLSAVLVIMAGSSAHAQSDASASDGPDISGYVKARHTWIKNTPASENDQDGFSVGFARLAVKDDSYHIKDKPGVGFYKVEIDVSTGALDLKDMYGGWGNDSKKNTIKFTAGQFKVPMALAELISERDLQFVDPPLLKALTYGRDRGIQLSGEVNPLGDSNLKYFAAVFNGEGPSTATRNSDEKYLYAGRLEVEPFGKMNADESDLRDDKDFLLSVGGSYSQTPKNARGKAFEIGQAEARYALDARVKVAGISLSAEWLQAEVDERMQNNVRIRPGFTRSAHYAQIGYMLPMLPVELVARTEVFDYTDADLITDLGYGPLNSVEAYRKQQDALAIEKHTLGLNWFYAGQNAKLQLNYSMLNHLEGVTNSGSGKPIVGDEVIAQVQIAFSSAKD